MAWERPSERAKPKPPAIPKAPAKSAIDIAVGDSIRHPTFGEGLVLSAKPMGNDTLLEIAFDAVSTKKLMANFAKLEKLDL